jgi:hypothetical protein
VENEDQLGEPSGEERIDEQGRNPTQQRMDEEGPDSRPVDVGEGAVDAGGPMTDPERPEARVVDDPDAAMQARQGDVGHDSIAASDDEIGDVIAD